MGQSVGDVYVNLGLRKSGFDTGTRQATATFKNFERQMKTAAAGIGAAIAGAFSVGAIMKAGKDVLDNADKMAKLSQSTGVAVETLSSFKYAADLSGSSIESIAKGLQILSRNMLDAQAGTGEASKAFKALGIDVEEAGRLLSSDEVLGKIAELFSKMEDGAAKTALAMRVFGKSGSELIPMLNTGSAGITEMREEAERLGLIMSQEMAQQAEHVNDQMTRLQGRVQGLTIQIMEGLLPTLENISDVYISTAKNTDEMTDASAILSGIIKGLVTGVQVLGTTFDISGKHIGGTAAAIVAFAKGEFSQGMEIIKMCNQDIEAETISTFEKINRIWDTETEQRLRERHGVKRSYMISAPTLEAPSMRSGKTQEASLMDIDVPAWKARQEAAIAIQNMLIEIDQGVAATSAHIPEKVETMSEAMKNAITGWGSHFSQQLNDAVWDADASFASIAESFGRMITQMIIQKAVVEPMIGAILPAFGMHDGGIVGNEASFMRIVPADVFHGAPRLHDGLLPDEFPAILQRGETVLSRDMTAGLGLGGRASEVHHHYDITIVAADARSFTDMIRRNPGAVIGPVREALRSGDQGLVGDMRSVM